MKGKINFDCYKNNGGADKFNAINVAKSGIFVSSSAIFFYRANVRVIKKDIKIVATFGQSFDNGTRTRCTA